MYVNADIIKNHTLQKLNNTLEKDDGETIPSINNASFNKYGRYWATTISVDIRNFKKMCDLYNLPSVIKLTQAFSSSLIKIMKENENYRYSTANGDEIIGVFSSSRKEKINDNFNTAILCNSFVNYLFPKLLKEKGYNSIEFKAGIGVWTSNDNSIIRYGEKGSANESHVTVIGSTINWASFLAKKSMKGNNCEILFNNLTKINLTEERLQNASQRYAYSVNNDNNISWLNFRYNEYAK